MEHRLPIGTAAAKASGLIDDHFGHDVASFRKEVQRLAERLAQSPEFEQVLKQKRERRLLDELQKPLEDYRAEELERMKLNFYGFDPSYHVARYNFVHRVPHSWTPLHLAKHRRRGKSRTEEEARGKR
jgi:putative two-component system hydrogenase maturation factor HypX/HoxX